MLSCISGQENELLTQIDYYGYKNKVDPNVIMNLLNGATTMRETSKIKIYFSIFALSTFGM